MRSISTKLLLALFCITGISPVLRAQNTQETFDNDWTSQGYVTTPATYGSFVYNVNSASTLGTVTSPNALWIGLASSFSITKTDKNAFRFVSFNADDAISTQSATVNGYLKGVLVAGPVNISIPVNETNFDFSVQSHFDEVDSVVMTGTGLEFYLEDWTYNLSPVAYAPTIFTNPTDKTVCAGTSTSFTVAGTDAPTSYSWQFSSNNGSSWTTITGANAGAVYTNYTSATLGVATTAALNGYQYHASATNAVGTSLTYSTAATLTANTSVAWNGGTSTNWGAAANWTGGCIPSTTIDAVIPVVTRQPVVPGGANVNVRNLTIASGASLTIASGSSLSVSGTSITNNGSVKGAGSYLTLASTTQTTLSGNGTYGVNLQLSTPAGAATGNTTSDTVKIVSGGILQLVNGTFVSRDKLMLAGDATGCGYIADINSPSTISGKVIISNYTLTAQRGYRMMGHPFTGNIPLSSLLPFVDISGNASSGFTAGASATPSAFYFNPATSTGTGGSGGWIPYTDASQTWNQANGLLLFVRGQAGQGLNTPYGYSISAPAISFTGTVNTTSPNITLQSSAYTGAAGWNLVPNVLPTPVYVYTSTINNIASAGISTSIYVWNPLKARTRSDSLAGGYDAYFISSAPVVPMFGAFFIKNTSTATGGAHIGDVTISYDPSTTPDGITPLKLLGAGAPYASGITFTLTSDNDAVYWDKTYLLFQKAATSKDNDKDDFEKMSNAGLNMYTVADSNKYLAVDARPEPVSINNAIALGITTLQQRVFTLKASDVYLDNPELYLHDKYTDTWTKIANGMQYEFAVTADSNSKGNARFEIAPRVTLVTPPTDSTVTVAPAGLTLKAGPNPVQSQLTISYTLPVVTAAAIVISNSKGQVIHTIDAGTAISGTQTVNTDTWTSGAYFIQLKTTAGSVTKQVVKR